MEIRRCQAQDIPALTEFISLNWKQGHILATSSELMDWQHKRDDGDYNYLLAWDQEIVQGVLGYIPTARYDSALKDRNVVWLALWKVRDACTTPMLGLRLLQALGSFEPNIGIAVNGINATHPPMYEALGYVVHDLIQYILVNPEMPNRILRCPEGTEFPVPTDGGAVIRETGAEALRHMKLEGHAFCIQKSPQYFISRFLNHPFYQYRVFTIEVAHKAAALIATRKTTLGESSMLRLVDFYGRSEILANSGHALLTIMQEEGCEYLEFWQHGIDHETLKSAGFIAIERDGKVIAPKYFEPLVVANGRIVCAIKTKSHLPAIVCRADGDQDRPNQLGA